MMHTISRHFESGCDAGTIEQSLHGIKERILNSSGNSWANIFVWVTTSIGAFLTEHWYTVFMVAFGAAHAYFAYRKNQRDEEDAEYRRRDRELQGLRDIRREQEKEELEKKLRAKQEQEALISHNQRVRNGEHFEKRAELHCENLKPRRSAVKAVK